jgi:hypothetical protein
MTEAKKRNPDILLYGLSWGVPGWIGNGSYFSQDNIDYHIKWLQGAEQVYGLRIFKKRRERERVRKGKFIIIILSFYYVLLLQTSIT